MSQMDGGLQGLPILMAVFYFNQFTTFKFCIVICPYHPDRTSVLIKIVPFFVYNPFSFGTTYEPLCSCCHYALLVCKIKSGIRFSVDCGSELKVQELQINHSACMGNPLLPQAVNKVHDRKLRHVAIFRPE